MSTVVSSIVGHVSSSNVSGIISVSSTTISGTTESYSISSTISTISVVTVVITITMNLTWEIAGKNILFYSKIVFKLSRFRFRLFFIFCFCFCSPLYSTLFICSCIIVMVKSHYIYIFSSAI